MRMFLNIRSLPKKVISLYLFTQFPESPLTWVVIEKKCFLYRRKKKGHKKHSNFRGTFVENYEALRTLHSRIFGLVKLSSIARENKVHGWHIPNVLPQSSSCWLADFYASNFIYYTDILLNVDSTFITHGPIFLISHQIHGTPNTPNTCGAICTH